MSYSSNNISGARESSAGDDFHLLWAGRGVLELLTPNAELKAVGIEGPDPEESDYLDPRGDRLLAIDLSEYYGGESFVTARQVVFSQLKYSTRNPGTEWTAARLCEGKGKSKHGSIVERLAQAFERYYTVYGRDEIIKKLRLKLVSNRPMNKELLGAIASAQNILQSSDAQIAASVVLHSLLASQEQEVKRLYHTSKLQSGQFTDFLRILDVSECGQESRQGQRFALVRGLGEFGGRDLHVQYAKLMELIRGCMMPEARSHSIITKDDVLPCFGLSSYRKAYPAESHFELPQKRISRRAAGDVAKLIRASSHIPVCLHSGAGQGKTLLANMLEDNLPPGSVVIVFDCYAGGTYLDTSEIRHTSARAIPQIANEIAARTGGTLLLDMNMPTEDLFRELMARIAIGISLIKKCNPDATLVLVIDAADNSIHAARNRQERSFVHDLLAQPFPVGSRLVVSCRTENIHLLDLPTHDSYHLEGFSLDESTRHLKLYFPSTSDAEAAEFHELTRGVPRSQGYALGKYQEGMEAVFAPLRPDGKSLDGIISDQLRQAGQRSSIRDVVSKICTALITLPRPIPTQYVGDLCNVADGAVESFCVDVGFGLTHGTDGTISFRDQDFEDYLRLNYMQENRELITQICDLLYRRRTDDRYAAYHVGTFLSRLERFPDLCDIILEENIPEALSDPLDRQDIVLQRIQFALRINASRHERVKSLQLLFAAADAVKADSAVRKIVLDNPDLVERFGDPATVQRLHLDITNSEWPVPDLLRSAAVLSRSEKTKRRSEEFLKSAEAWLRRWDSLREQDQYKYSIAAEDITNGAEAVLQIHGASAARRWLSNWRPSDLVYTCTSSLVSRLIDYGDAGKLEEAFSDASLHVAAKLAIIHAYKDSNVSPPKRFIENAVSVLCRFSKRGGVLAPYMQADIVTLCEFAVQVDALADMGPRVLGLFSMRIPDYGPSLYGEEKMNIDTLLRGRVLDATLKGECLTIDAFLPDRLKVDNSNPSSAERQEIKDAREKFSEVFGTLLPAYVLRTTAMLRQSSPAVLRKQYYECLGTIDRDYRVRFRHDASAIYMLLAGALADTALIVVEQPVAWLKDIEQSISDRVPKVGNNSLQFLLAERLLTKPEFHEEILRLLHDIREAAEQYPGTASEQIETFIHCTRIASRVDLAAAQEYFSLAVGAASDVDEEAYKKMECLSLLAVRSQQNSNAECAYQLARFAEDCHARMYGWEHFPWQSVVMGVTSLDPASGFAIVSRWDDRGVLDIEEQFLTVLDAVVGKYYISPGVAHAMSILVGEGYDERNAEFIMSLLQRQFDRRDYGQTKALLSLIETDIMRNVPMDERKTCAKAVTSWAAAHNLGHLKAVTSLRQLADFLDSQVTSNAQDRASWSPARSSEVLDWTVILLNHAYVTPEEIEAGILTIRNLRPYESDLISEFLRRIQDHVQSKDYEVQLDALLKVDRSIISWHTLLEALGSRFAAWESNPRVRQWKDLKRFEVLSQCFESLVSHEFFLSYDFETFVKAFSVDKTEVFDLILAVIPRWVDVSPQTMYGVIQELLPLLNSIESYELLQWLLERVSANIKGDRADGSWCQELRPPRDPVETLAMFIWGLLGHPDKRIRWRTAHAARRLVQLDHSDVLDRLVAHVDDTDASVFRDKHNRFYWLSARLWLFMLLDRLAHESPSVIKPHWPRITREALEPDIPHVLIRQFAKTTSLALCANCPELCSEDLRERLLAINISTVAKKSRRRHSNGLSRKTKNLRFHFDSMDVLPYWYGPLGGVFGTGSAAVEELADRWISDVWSVSQDDVQKERKLPGRTFSYDERGPRHGEIPPVEALDTYVQWHAMFCVADELLHGRPVSHDEYEEDPFGDWLSRYTTAYHGYWLTDLRDPLPLDGFYWQLKREEQVDWDRAIPDDVFDPRVGIEAQCSSEMLVLDEWSQRAADDEYESVSISSALVTPETAPALLRALQTAADPWDYRIPPEGDYLEIRHNEFELVGWLHEARPAHEGLDSLDPMRRDLSSVVIVPSADFISWGGLAPSLDHKRYSKTGEQDPVTQFECWSETRGNVRYHGWFTSNGLRLWVHSQTLFGYLQHRQRCLIIGCSIRRSSKKKGPDEHVPAKAKIYLLYPDGKVETLR